MTYYSEGRDEHATRYHDIFKPNIDDVEWSLDDRIEHDILLNHCHEVNPNEDNYNVGEELDMIANLISKDQIFLKREVEPEASGGGGGGASPTSTDRFGHSLHASASRSTTNNNGVARQCTSNDTDSPGSCSNSPASNDMHTLHGSGNMQMHHILQQHANDQQHLQQQHQQQLLQQQQQQHNGNTNGTSGLFHTVYQSPVDITGFLQFKTEAGGFDMSNFLGMSTHFPNVSLASPGGVPLNSLHFGAAAAAASSQPMMHHLNVQPQQAQPPPSQASTVGGQSSASASTPTTTTLAPKKTRTRHSNDNMLKCQFCPKKFSLEHIDSHRNECRLIRCHECSQCGKRFKARGGLQQHNRIHLQERHYACNYCTKRFTQKSHLDQHERIHTGMKPFSCQYCGRSFRQRSQQIGHEATHPQGSTSQSSSGHHQGPPSMVLNTSSGSSSGVFSTNTTASDQSSISDNSLDSSPSGAPSQVIQLTTDHLNQVSAIQQAAMVAQNNAIANMLAPNGSIKQELLSGR